MFSLFKRKQNLLPKDISKALLTSNFVEFKLGEHINIPNNVVCLIRYKDKTYKELSSGDYSLNKEFLLDLYTKQLKQNKKLKSLKADLYFINLNQFNFEFEFVDKIPLNKITEKFLINVKLNIQVEDSSLFFKNLVYENTAPTAETTKNLIIEYTENKLRKFFLKQYLNSTNLTLEQIKQINSILFKSFKNIGLSFSELSVDLFKKSNKIVKQDNLTTIETTPKEPEANNTEENSIKNKNDEKLNILNFQFKNENVCPKCNNKLISGSIFCHKCGYRK